MKVFDRLTRNRFEWTAAKLLLGAGAGASPTEVDLPAGGGLAIFGDGSDGNITISSDTDLVKDMFYDDLTINATYTLSTKGFRIFVKGTLTNNGTISASGVNCTNADGVNPFKGDGASAGSLGGGGDGALNPAGDTNGIAGTSVTVSLGGAGGAGGTAGSYTGGAAGGVTAPATTVGGFRGLPFAVILKDIDTTVAKVTGGGGGGSGGNDNPTDYRSGGGGGGGGILFIVAKTIVNSSGTIKANGGKGGDSEGAYAAAGGGGGGGGCVILIYNSLTTGTETANGGTGGTGGGGAGNGVNGTNGIVIKIANA